MSNQTYKEKTKNRKEENIRLRDAFDYTKIILKEENARLKEQLKLEQAKNKELSKIISEMFSAPTCGDGEN